ncbi:MAG: 5'-nucleotidase [Bacteroidota bacterium]
MKLILSYVRTAIWLAYPLIFLLSCASPKDYDISYAWSPVEINSDVEGSEHIEAIIAPYRDRLDSTMEEVIGYASHDLTTQGEYESTLGTFVTKLLRDQSASFYEKQVDVAIMNHHGGLRAPINKGPITLGEVFEVMPFENEMVLLDIPGDSLTKVIEFISQSGRSMIWPASFHITASGVENIQVDGQEIDPNKHYTLAISDYLANGGGSFKMLKPLKRLDVRPIKLRDMIVQEIKQQTAKGDSIQMEVLNLITVSDQ